MKILCETNTLNRRTQSSKSRAVKATLALGYNTKAIKSHQDSLSSTSTSSLPSKSKELELIHFTPQNKYGIRYKIKNNIEKMFTKFVQDGKATISFKNPPDNLMIKCDPIQLKGFLQIFKLGIIDNDNNNIDTSKIRLNIATATSIPQKSHPVHRMTVLKRSGYPIKGFPKTLKSLIITDIKLCKISYDICNLKNLTLLNLSDNSLKNIPIELGNLPLIELNLTNNQLSESTTSWKWLNNLQLRKTLKELQLSQNNIKYFPNEILKLTNLITLKLNHNLIRKIPFGIRRMKNLRYLYLSNNCLESLPSSFNETYLEILDVWGNNFQPQCTTTIDYRKLNSNNDPLWLLSARIVSNSKLQYTSTTLPAVLIDLLLETPKCLCGKLCYLSTIFERATLATLTNISKMISGRDRLIYADIVICSSHCAARVEYEQMVTR